MKCIGLKPSRKIPILNGDLDCTFNQYELFSGEHKEYKKNLAEGKIERREESEYQHHKYQSHRRSDAGAPHRKYSRRPQEDGERKPFRKEGGFSRGNMNRGGRRPYGKDSDR